MNQNIIEIYTDGSCHSNYNIGAWAAILLIGKEKIILKGEIKNTTHNRMELLAVINAIEFADKNYNYESLIIYTDSQYVSLIPERKEKLKRKNFFTNRGNSIQNSDLVKNLISQIESHSIEFIKVKAHQQKTSAPFNIHKNFNSEVDKLARQLVREAVRFARLGYDINKV